MATLLWWWLPPATAWLDAGLWDRAWWLTTAVAAGIGGYALGVMALGGDLPGRDGLVNSGQRVDPQGEVGVGEDGGGLLDRLATQLRHGDFP